MPGDRGMGGKRVLLEEFGYADWTAWDISEHGSASRCGESESQYFADDAAGGRYYGEVLDKLARCGALGAFAWMFSDYDPCLWHRPPFSRRSMSASSA